MNETGKHLGLGALVLLPVVCCVGVPLLAAAGVSVAVAAWAGGISVGVVVLAAVALLLGVRIRRHRRGRRGTLVPTTRSQS